jgi:hypothetical protein
VPIGFDESTLTLYPCLCTLRLNWLAWKGNARYIDSYLKAWGAKRPVISDLQFFYLYHLTWLNVTWKRVFLVLDTSLQSLKTTTMFGWKIGRNVNIEAHGLEARWVKSWVTHVMRSGNRTKGTTWCLVISNMNNNLGQIKIKRSRPQLKTSPVSHH